MKSKKLAAKKENKKRKFLQAPQVVLEKSKPENPPQENIWITISAALASVVAFLIWFVVNVPASEYRKPVEKGALRSSYKTPGATNKIAEDSRYYNDSIGALKVEFKP